MTNTNTPLPQPTFHTDELPHTAPVDWTAASEYAQHFLFLVAVILGCWLTLYCFTKWGAAAGIAGAIAGIAVAVAVLHPVEATAYVAAPLMVLGGILALLLADPRGKLLGALAVIVGLGTTAMLTA